MIITIALYVILAVLCTILVCSIVSMRREAKALKAKRALVKALRKSYVPYLKIIR